jgi:hypothetical protein
VNVETVGEKESVAVIEIGSDRAVIQILLVLIRHEHHDEVGPLGCSCGGHHR